MRDYDYLYLDFDGVICDSVLEAFYCSYLAYHAIPYTEDPSTYASDANCSYGVAKDIFFQYRPFIRSGQHLMLLQHCINRDIALHTQQDFETQLQHISAEQLQTWRNQLYTIRERMHSNRFSTYIALNTLYPHVQKHVHALSTCANAYILSTKRTDMIAIVLQHNQITWPSERIFSVDKKGKITAIQERAHRRNTNIAFIDDHLPHILTIEQGAQYGIDCFLADWGYVLAEWKENNDYVHLNEEQFSPFVDRFLMRK